MVEGDEQVGGLLPLGSDGKPGGGSLVCWWKSVVSLSIAVLLATWMIAGVNAFYR